MNSELVERVVLRFAKMSDEQKDKVVTKVMDNLKSKDDSSKSDDNKESTEKSVDKKEPTEKSEVVPVSTDDASVDEKGLEQIVETLRQEIEKIQADGKVERGEFLRMFNQMMEMVTSLIDVRPPAKKRKKVDGSRGQQVVRKDKDLMSDTGGTSKGRIREPHNKPPRDDMKNRYKPKRQTSDDLDKDTDQDVDLKTAGSPLDRVVRVKPGVTAPEMNYHRIVWGNLVRIESETKRYGSDNQAEQKHLMKEVESFLRTPLAAEFVEYFRGSGHRPQLCAEILFKARNLKSKDSDE